MHLFQAMITDKVGMGNKAGKTNKQRALSVKTPSICVKNTTQILQKEMKSMFKVKSLLPNATLMQTQMQRIFATEFPQIDLATVFVNVEGGQNGKR